MSGPHLRNIGIVAHIDAGKTTVSERILFYTGVERRMGEVHEGTAVMDWMEEERKRGITIMSAATTAPWREYSINLIDTPGHVDFTVEVERCLRVLDGAVLVLNGVAGIQAQSETVWRQMRRHRVPYIVFVNQCDRPGADYFRVIEDFEKRLGVRAVPVQFPLGKEREMRTVVDLLALVAWKFNEADLGREPQLLPVPDEVRDEVGVLRAELLDVLAEEDEEVLAAVLEEREPALEVLQTALRRRVLAGTLVPCLLGSALRNVGIQPLLDAVTAYLPAPEELPPVEGLHPKEGTALSRPPTADAPTCALAFKLQADPHDDLTFVRVYSGVVRPNEKIFNPRTWRMERVSRVLRMHADHRLALDAAGPGEIVALTGLKLTATGDTLCDRADPIVLGALEFPEPVITKTVEPAKVADRDKLQAALERLVHEDPTFRVREDEETGQWLIAGMGELHLEIVQHRLRDEFHVDATVGQPRVAYREAPRRAARGRAEIERTLGGKDVFGEVDLEILPAAGAQPPEVEWGVEEPLPEGLRAALQEGLVAGCDSGPRFGFPIVGALLRVVGARWDLAREPEIGLVQAGHQALRDALGTEQVQLLEPVMSFEIAAPDEFMSGIIGELNASGAEIANVEVEGAARSVSGVVPLVRMFGFSTTLRSLSQGRASFSMSPAGFRPVPEAELEERGLVWS